MKVRTLVARLLGGAITPKNDWRLYAGNTVAPLRRKSGGAITPEIRWRHYAENEMAPMCRKFTIGSSLQPDVGRCDERWPGDGRARDYEFPKETVASIRTVGREGDCPYLVALGTSEALELPQLHLVSKTEGRFIVGCAHQGQTHGFRRPHGSS